MAKKKRNYRKEYDEYHAKPGQKKNRASRNKAARKAKCGKGKEADHKVPLSKGGSKAQSNVRCVTRKKNRKKGSE